MTDKQAGWVVVPSPCSDAMVDAGWHAYDVDRKPFRAALNAAIAASPRYEPGDAVEVAAETLMKQHSVPEIPASLSWKEICDEWPVASACNLDIAKIALTAAFPELLARIEALESEVRNLTARRNELQADYMSSQYQLEQLQADVDRLRKGVL